MAESTLRSPRTFDSGESWTEALARRWGPQGWKDDMEGLKRLMGLDFGGLFHDIWVNPRRTALIVAEALLVAGLVYGCSKAPEVVAALTPTPRAGETDTDPKTLILDIWKDYKLKQNINGQVQELPITGVSAISPEIPLTDPIYQSMSVSTLEAGNGEARFDWIIFNRKDGAGPDNAYLSWLPTDINDDGTINTSGFKLAFDEQKVIGLVTDGAGNPVQVGRGVYDPVANHWLSLEYQLPGGTWAEAGIAALLNLDPGLSVAEGGLPPATATLAASATRTEAPPTSTTAAPTEIIATSAPATATAAKTEAPPTAEVLRVGEVCNRLDLDQSILEKVNDGKTLTIDNYCGLGLGSATLLFSDVVTTSVTPGAWSTKSEMALSAGYFGTEISLLNMRGLTLESRSVWSVALTDGSTVLDAVFTFLVSGAGDGGRITVPARGVVAVNNGDYLFNPQTFASRFVLGGKYDVWVGYNEGEAVDGGFDVANAIPNIVQNEEDWNLYIAQWKGIGQTSLTTSAVETALRTTGTLPDGTVTWVIKPSAVK